MTIGSWHIMKGRDKEHMINLFKRVETRKGLFAVEKITLIYNLLTSILILFLFQEMDHPVQMLVDRAMIAPASTRNPWSTAISILPRLPANDGGA